MKQPDRIAIGTGAFNNKNIKIYFFYVFTEKFLDFI